MALPRVTQLNILQGSAQEEGPYTYAHVLPGEGEPVYLFLLFEAKGPTPEATCAGAAETFLQTFSETRRSVTGRLVEALKTVHEALLWENHHSLQEHQATLGAVCLYLKGSDIYLAHAGPSLAYVIGPGGGRHLAPAPGGPAPRLGSPREPPVWVRHHHLSPEESILLASSNLAQTGNERELFAAFQRGLEEGMVAVYRRSQLEQEFAALGVDPGVGRAIAGAAPGTTPSLRSAEKGPPQASAFPRPAYTYDRSQTPYPFPARAAASDVSLGGGVNLSLKLREPRHWVRGPLLNLFPPRLLIGLVAVFLMGGLFLGARATLQRVERQAFVEAAQLVQAAQKLESQAQQAPTGDARRQIYNQALNQLKKAQQQDPANTEAITLQNRIQATLTRLDAAYELTALRTLVDFATVTGTTALIRGLAHYSGGFYILDKSGDRIFQVPLPDLRNEGTSPVPTTLHQPQGSARRNLVSLVWMPQGGSWPRDSLLVLDSNRSLQEFRQKEDPRPLPLRGAPDWASFQTAAGFEGNLYILDPKASQVWRYVPTDNGFDSERRAALPSVDLRDALDMVLDGDVYVLLRDGKVLKFSNGRPQPFSQDGLDRPLLRPIALFADPATKALYVADAGNNRIAVFNKADGKFLRQYLLPDSTPIYDLWVDEGQGALFMVSDARLYLAKIPPG